MGAVSAEIQDLEGRPMESFAAEDMDPLFGDDLDVPVAWKGSGDLSRLNGVPVPSEIHPERRRSLSIRFGNR